MTCACSCVYRELNQLMMVTDAHCRLVQTDTGDLGELIVQGIGFFKQPQQLHQLSKDSHRLLALRRVTWIHRVVLACTSIPG